jgi:hypothetical protein
MATMIRRHQNDTKTFEELTAKEQALLAKPKRRLPDNWSEWRCTFEIFLKGGGNLASALHQGFDVHCRITATARYRTREKRLNITRCCSISWIYHPTSKVFGRGR